MTKTCMWFELKTRHLEKSGVFILLKACPTGFLNGKMASPKFQFSSPGRRTWGIFNPCHGQTNFNYWSELLISDFKIFCFAYYCTNKVEKSFLKLCFQMRSLLRDIIVERKQYCSQCLENAWKKMPRDDYLVLHPNSQNTNGIHCK